MGDLCGSLTSRLDYGPFDTSSPHWRPPGVERQGVRHPELDDEERIAVWLRTCTCVMPTPAIPTHGVVAGGTLEHTTRRGRAVRRATSPYLSQTSAGVHFPTSLPPHALCVNACRCSLQVAALLCSLASSVPGRRLLDSRFTLDACLGLLSLTLLRLSDSVPSAPEPVKGVSTHANLLVLLVLVFVIVRCDLFEL